ncbi:hypothetical protein N9Y92_03175 [Chlamydiales bacterium]|nr:hypothetical protein [Chlamydiales bacterium]
MTDPEGLSAISFIQKCIREKAAYMIDEMLVLHPEKVGEREALVERKVADLTEEHKQHAKDIFTEIALAKELFNEKIHALSSVEQDAIKYDLEKAKEVAPNISFVELQESKDFCLQKELCISDETLIEMEKLAYELIGKGELEKAKAVYYYLTIVNRFVPNFWIGYAYCCNELAIFNKAVSACKWAIYSGEQGPLPYIYLVSSYVNIKEDVLAKAAYETAKSIIEANEKSAEYQPYLDGCKEVLENI